MTPATSGPPLYPIASVDNALRLLLMLRDVDELRLSQAARELGVANSTAHRLLRTLEHHGFVAQNPETKAYRVGPTIVELGLHAVRSIDLRTAARPVLDHFAATLEETVHLAVLDGRDVRYLDAVESPKMLRVGLRTGLLRPAHCTSTGKVLLAELDDGELAAMYPRKRLPPPATSKSVTSFDALVKELETIRRRGYAVNVGESERGLTSVAVAVRARDRRAIAAVSCAAPSNRLPASRFGDMAGKLAGAADEIAARLS